MLNHLEFKQHLKAAVAFHGHLCLGQIIGVRLAMFGLDLVGISDPLGADRKKLIVFVEIGRCAADAIMTVTGSRVGRRSMKIIDYGKLAATFVNLETGVAFRIFSHPDAQKKAFALYPTLPEQEAEMRAYQEMEEHDMFDYLAVRVPIKCEDMPGRPTRKVQCALCGEYVLDARDIDRYGHPFCRPCATGNAYYTIEHPDCAHLPQAVGQ
ncbi:formylmethanofuran dehydrogenase [Desulfobulbus rhabdoformis]|uniref:FmdE family protein n=1 Tax=Desulfobulbus rhabdoformis TaxID=34032 RepID=UPI001962CABB|nr:FmdE family protein [Desulfobulbus rhabdoformis]MBM9615535.1 formylmethanofuran dehydrogenase [Desulfobulbus rhabdoformis]